MDNSETEMKTNTPGFRISLRTWMVLFTMLILLLGYWATRATKQRNIVSALAASGARMMYRYQYDNFDDVERYSSNFKAKPPWLAEYAGIDYCSPIVRVTSIGADNPSEVAQLCSQLPMLRLLAIQETNFQAKDLKWLLGLRHLRGLYLAETHISDEAVPYLVEMPWIRVLNIQGTDLSPQAITSLKAALPTTKIHSGKRARGFFSAG